MNVMEVLKVRVRMRLVTGQKEMQKMKEKRRKSRNRGTERGVLGGEG